MTELLLFDHLIHLNQFKPKDCQSQRLVAKILKLGASRESSGDKNSTFLKPKLVKTAFKLLRIGVKFKFDNHLTIAKP